MVEIETHRIHVLIAALKEREKAKKKVKPEDNPLVNHTLEQLTDGVGVAKSADHFPAVNMAAQAPDNPAAFSMESQRIADRTKGRENTSAKRMAQHRDRAQRKVEFDRIAKARFTPEPERMDKAWLIVFHMVEIITKIAKEKQSWANRLLGSAADDVPQMAIEKMAMVLAKSDKDLDLLLEAAEQLGEKTKITGRIPGDQMADLDKEEKTHRRQLRKARKWLMGMANNRVMGALVDAYTDQRNLRWDNLDIITTVMASIGGTGSDPMTSRFKHDRAPAMVGSKFQEPGGIDPALLAAGINAAITARQLDPLVEFILDEDHRRVNGSVRWSEFAQDIFLLDPSQEGEWMWAVLYNATLDHRHARKARGDAARQHVRNLFAWLPGLVSSLVDSFDPHFIGWHDGRAILSSDFELFLPEGPKREDGTDIRLNLEPALKYATVEEAARDLVEHLAVLTTGTEYVKHLVNS